MQGRASLKHLSSNTCSHSLSTRKPTAPHQQHLTSSRSQPIRRTQPVQASFSTASHGSLDSIDDEIDFKIDDDLRSQIEQMGIQKRDENTLEQLEASSKYLAMLKAVHQHQHPHQFSFPHAACNTLFVCLIARLSRLQATTSEAESRGEVVAAFVGAALVFGVGIWNTLGVEKAQEFFAGYLLEQSLSVDNLFVFILVFRYFRAPKADQDKVLKYGIGTAAVLRLVMILLGSELIESWKPVLLLFAGILLFSSYKLLASGDSDDADDEDLSDNGIVKLCRRLIPVSETYDGASFFTIQNGKRVATPLLLVLAVVELSDVVFAVDSIPAVFGITTDPFIVYSSNMFAILSLRALYGFVNTIMSELKYLDKAVALVLGFIGAKMVADFGGYHVPTITSLGVVVTTLAGGVAASLWLPGKAGSKQ
ncbi:TPA: hypothetical protein ACH3X3_000131 [Trebouxia sp. C0006]